MKRLALFLFLIIFGLGIFLVWWQNGIQAVNPKNTSSKIFIINKGERLREIASALKEKNLIKDPTVFFLFVKKQGVDTNIQAGSYKLSPSMSLQEIVDNLRHGTLDVWVTFPEGVRAEEVADILSQNIGNINDAARQSLAANEGYLFPDTYLIPRNTTVEKVIEMMRSNFNAKTAGLNLTPGSQQLARDVIIASLIEREAKNAHDRKLVSSVIHNRLNAGMPLELDATVQYALGKSSGQSGWWQQVTPKDLQVNSPYNTYKNIGLPPAPICNPGLSAIEAAQHPANTDYLYYVSDKNGNLHFASTLDGQNENIVKYLNN